MAVRNEAGRAELDRAAYALVKDFLSQSGVKGVTPALIEGYLDISAASRPPAMAGIYARLLASAQNAGMKPGVIGGAVGGVDKLGPVLCDFDPVRVLEKYPNGWEEVFDDIRTRLKPKGRVRNTPRALWPQYCRSIISGAEFLSRFATAEEFYAWADSFDENERDRTELPMHLAKEIHGLGFALACDFLKEMGYANFSKPDVHIKDIFRAIGLCSHGADDYEVFRAVDRMASTSGSLLTT